MRAAALILLMLIALPGDCAQFAVVVAQSSPIGRLEEGKIRDIFLKRRGFDAGVRLVPVNLLGDDASRVEFESRVLQMDREEINRYWIANHFQGISPPATQASLGSVKLFVERVKGAIGYLPIEMVDASVKVVHEF